MCEHARRTIRVHTRGPDGQPTHVAWQCDDCFAVVKIEAGIWLSRRFWPRSMEGWLNSRTGKATFSFSTPNSDPSNWSASTQLLYVKLAAKSGNWNALERHGFDPTDTMKRLYIQMRAKYIQWKRRRDMQDELEAAAPKSWFEIEPGHWVWERSEEAARTFAAEFFAPSQEHQPLHARDYPYIDTSRTCPKCGNPSLGLGIEKCPVCWTPNTKWNE